jgi:hypothetical protein
MSILFFYFSFTGVCVIWGFFCYDFTQNKKLSRPSRFVVFFLSSRTSSVCLCRPFCFFLLRAMNSSSFTFSLIIIISTYLKKKKKTYHFCCSLAMFVFKKQTSSFFLCVSGFFLFRRYSP